MTFRPELDSAFATPGNPNNRGGRNEQISRALRAVSWVSKRRREFHWSEFSEEMEIGRRAAYRWLVALEANGVVEQAGFMNRPQNGRGYFRALR